MKNQEAHSRIKSKFQEIEKMDGLKKLDKFILESKLKDRIDTFYTKYPSFDFRLTTANIQALKSKKVITSDHRLDAENFPNDPLTKLLAAVLWKNGDIHKVQHLIDGITGREGDRTPYALIFRQFGASLASEQEPIVDQHVLRAFEIYSLKEDSDSIVEKIRKKTVYKSNDKSLLDDYKRWFKKTVDKVPESEQPAFREKLDKVLFPLGKQVKS